MAVDKLDKIKSVDKKTVKFEYPIFIPKHLCGIFTLEDSNYPVSAYLKKMVEMLQGKGINNKNVLEIFLKIDRKYFLNYNLDEENGYPYNDVPKPIGWNTTISAPSMHAETLHYLHDQLKTAKRVLDIGTGSGFMTAAMAYVCPSGAKIYAVDHIQAINDFALTNIQNICPYLLRKHELKFVTQDGRRGLKSYEGEQLKFDVIHVGGQLNEVPVDQSEQNPPVEGEPRPSRKIKIDKELLGQLAPGGRMWIPLSSQEHNSDDEDGEEGLSTTVFNREDIPDNLATMLIRSNGAGGGNRAQNLRGMSVSALTRRMGVAHHEVYVIDRDMETHRLSFKKIMDARYAQLRSVES